MARLARVKHDLELPSRVPYSQFKRAIADSVHSEESDIEFGDSPTPSPEPQFAYCLPYRFPIAATGLCLEGRFIVTAVWDNPFDAQGVQPAYGVNMTTLAGYFFFAGQGNPEVVIKEINGCFSGTPSHWIFASGMTNFESRSEFWTWPRDRRSTTTTPGANFNTIIDQNTPFFCP